MNINANNYVAEFIVLCQPLSPSSYSMFILWRIIPILYYFLNRLRMDVNTARIMM